jgi:hypothetical protein
VAPVDTDDYRWLARLWPIALLFHLAGNSDFIIAWFRGTPTLVAAGQVMVAVIAVLLLARPRPPIGVALAIGFLAVTWLKAPRIGNHEVLLALVALVLLVSAMAYDQEWLRRAAPGLRWLFVIAYAAMALSKLNRGFLSREVSCAVLFGDELGRWIGVEASASDNLAWGAIVVALVIELSIPILLVTRRWRNLGVLIGLLFHTGLALDPVGHVFDFTSALTPMFLLFADDDTRIRLGAGLERLASSRAGPGRDGWGLAALATVAVGASGIALSAPWPRWVVAYPVWLLYMAAVIGLVVSGLRWRHARTGDLNGARFGFRISLPLIPMIVLTAVNALSPYVGMRTAAGFNMYSNLETVVEPPNHLLFGDVTPMRDVELVEITAAPDDHPLSYYVGRSVAIPAENLRRWVLHQSSADDAQVELRWLGPGAADRSNRLSGVEPAGTGWLDLMAYKLAFRRSVDLQTPARCLREWGPVG